MRRNLTRALAAAAVVLGGGVFAGPAPVEAKPVDVGVNGCELGPSNFGHCTVLITDPGTYVMYTRAEPDNYTWTTLGCVPFVKEASTQGYGAQVAVLYVHEGKCELEMYAYLDAATVKFYRYSG